MIALVAAMARNRVIGKDGKMPWHLPAELAHFRRLTKGHAVVMGRKTYESIGEPLKGRVNVVLTRDKWFAAPGCEVRHAVDDLIGDERALYVIGGAEIYRLFMPHADVIHVTQIDAEFEGDTFFPAIDRTAWQLTDSTVRPRDEKNAFDCTFEIYRRVNG